MRALVIEDDSVSARMIESALKGENMVCEPADCGEDGQRAGAGALGPAARRVGRGAPVGDHVGAAGGQGADLGGVGAGLPQRQGAGQGFLPLHARHPVTNYPRSPAGLHPQAESRELVIPDHPVAREVEAVHDLLGKFHAQSSLSDLHAHTSRHIGAHFLTRLAC